MIRFIIIIHCVPCVENYRGREKDVLESAIIYSMDHGCECKAIKRINDQIYDIRRGLAVC